MHKCRDYLIDKLELALSAGVRCALRCSSVGAHLIPHGLILSGVGNVLLRSAKHRLGVTADVRH